MKLGIILTPDVRSKAYIQKLFLYKKNIDLIILLNDNRIEPKFSKEEIDYQTEVRGSSFVEDLNFLKQHFSLKVPGKKELSAKKYEKFDPKLVPIFLGIGLLFMVLGYFVMKKLK